MESIRLKISKSAPAVEKFYLQYSLNDIDKIKQQKHEITRFD